MLIVIIGESGAGKTTLRNHLCDKYGFRLAEGLPTKPVPDDKNVVVDWPPPALELPRVTLDSLPIMSGPVGAGRDLVGAVELLGGIVIEVSRKRLSGIGVVLPSGARGVDDGRLLRTADRFMELLDVTKSSGMPPKEFGATALLSKAGLAAILPVLQKSRGLKGRAFGLAVDELERARATLEQ